MARIHLQALLPSRDGTGWYAVQEKDRIHRCSTKGCTKDAIAYHHAIHGGAKRLWRNKYHCEDHLTMNFVVMHGRVWIDRPAAD